MRTPRRLLLTVRLLRPLIHVVVIMSCFFAMSHLRQYTDLIPFVQLRIPQIDIMETMMFALLSALIFLVIGLANGLYALFFPLHNYYRRFLQTWGLWVVVSSFVAFMGFGFLFENGISRFVLVVGAGLVWLVLTLIDTSLNRRNTNLEKKDPYRVVVMSNDDQIGNQVMSYLQRSGIYHLEPFSVDMFSTLPEENDIVVVVGQVEKEQLQRIADEARILGQSFYHVGDTLFLEDLISVPQRIGPLMALAYKSSPLDGRWRVVKRSFDIVASLILIVVLFPLFVVVGVLIKIDSKGPILYRQARVGKNKQPFTFIKLRTMFTHLSVGEEYGGEQAEELYQELIDSEQNVREGVLSKIEDDPRVTRVGKWLRKTSLDELPSLWTVLIGDMSLVGPRPHMPHEVDQYDRWQERLFSIKPGITGYAQLFGRDKLPFDEEAKLDLWYIQNWSLALDVFVLISTLKVVGRGH